jgi:hypothetical protein
VEHDWQALDWWMISKFLNFNITGIGILHLGILFESKSDLAALDNSPIFFEI